MKHGTVSAYAMGCHCPDCRAAHNAYMRDRKRRVEQKPIPDFVVHGRYTTYHNWVCRCEPCTAANTQYFKELRARRNSKTEEVVEVPRTEVDILNTVKILSEMKADIERELVTMVKKARRADYTWREIAEALDVPLPTAYSRYHISWGVD